MSYLVDIPDDSPAGRKIKQIMEEHHVSASEAVQIALRDTANRTDWGILGAFSNEEDADVLDRALDVVREAKKIEAERSLE